MTHVTSVVRGYSLHCRWRPPEVTRERQSELGYCRGRTCGRVYAAFLKRADVLSMSPLMVLI